MNLKTMQTLPSNPDRPQSPMLFSNREILRLTIPLILQQVLSITIGAVDTMMVAAAGETAVSGVSLVNTLDTMLVLLFSSMITGGSVLISQAIGRRDERDARTAAKQLLYISTLIAAAVTLIVVIFRVPLLHLLFGKAEDAVMDSALSYFFFVSLSFPFLAIENSGASIFRVHGNSLIGLKLSIILNLLNVSGNALLIYVFHMGAAGAAISTLFSRLVGAAVMLVLMTRKQNPFRIERLLHYRPDATMIRSILRIGVPNGIENGMFQFGRLMTQSLVSSLGTTAIAANAVALTLANYQYMPGNALGGVIIPVVGRCVGAGEQKQAKYYSRLFVGATYVLIWLVVLVTVLFAKPIISVYDLSAESAALTHQLVIYHCITASLIWPIAFTLAVPFRAASDVRFPLVISVFSMWVFRVAFSYVFALEHISLFGVTIPGLGLGVLGIFIAMTLDWIFRAVLFLYRYLSGKWLMHYKPL
ncbi:MAG: MATE family efflux transporter [Ruminococcaceae bacterium]|nr:MATE family efflux transporter [Oscillospiraceae bacterium]